MAKERGTCIHYICENECDLGKEATFWKHCQICPTWKLKPGSKNPKPDYRQKKREAIYRKESKEVY